MYFILFITLLLLSLYSGKNDNLKQECTNFTIFGLLTWQRMDKLTAFLVYFESCEMYFIECYRKQNKSKGYKYIIYVYLKRLSPALFLLFDVMTWTINGELI